MPRMSRKSYSYHGVSEGETEEAQRLRFQVELEFVQCLASPNYLHFLAQRNYFKEKSFINYLKHLQYWKEPEYAKFLKYPMCLYFLDLLQHENFRKEIVNGQCAKFIDDQMILHWQHYTRKRMKILETGSQQQAPSVAGSSLAGVTGSAAGGTTPSAAGGGGGNTPLHNSPGFAAPSSGAAGGGIGGTTPGNDSPAASTSVPSLTSAHTTLPSTLNPVGLSGSSVANASISSANLTGGASGNPSSLNLSLLNSPILNTGGTIGPPSGGGLLSSGSGGPNTGVGSSPRVSSPGNLSPANVLNGHSQKMQ